MTKGGACGHFVTQKPSKFSHIFVGLCGLIFTDIQGFLLVHIFYMINCSLCVFLFFFKTAKYVNFLLLTLLLSGDTLFQMAEVHRQIQVQLEDVVRKMPKNNLKFIWLNAV